MKRYPIILTAVGMVLAPIVLAQINNTDNTSVNGTIENNPNNPTNVNVPSGMENNTTNPQNTLPPAGNGSNSFNPNGNGAATFNNRSNNRSNNRGATGATGPTGNDTMGNGNPMGAGR